MSASPDRRDRIQSGYCGQCLFTDVPGVPRVGPGEREVPQWAMSALILGVLAAAVMVVAFGSAALAATAAAQVQGLPGAAYLPSFLASDQHSMAFAMLALVLGLLAGRGYRLYRVLSGRTPRQGVRA